MESKTENVKLTELTLYIAKRLESLGSCGTVKLNKLLFFADILAYGTLGRSITAAKYVRQPMGPVAAEMVNLKKRLVASKRAIVAKKSPSGGAFTEDRLVVLGEVKSSVFTPEELSLVERVISLYGNKTGAELSEISHRFGGWQLARTGERIPYATIFVPEKPLQPTPAQRAWGESVLSQLAA